MTGVKQHAGIYAAPVMPFGRGLEPDIPRYLAHCRRLLDAGCHGLMPLGSTGESHSLSIGERLALMSALAQSGMPVDRMLMGASALAFPDAVTLVQAALDAGAGGVCVQPPFYHKPLDDDALYGFYARLIDEVGDPALRLYVYDWEPNIQVHHSIRFFRRLFEAYPENAVGIKDSSGMADMLTERCAAFPDREIFVGADSMTLLGVGAGAAGTMSSISNIVPDLVVELYDKAVAGQGVREQARVDQIRREMSGQPWLPSLKAVLESQLGDSAFAAVRPPMRSLTDAEKDALLSRLAAIGVSPDQVAAE